MLLSSPVVAFVETARQYCALIDQHDAYDAMGLLREVHKLLPLLYHHALFLPEVEGSDSSPDSQITFEEWQGLFLKLRAMLGEHDGYWLVHNPYEREEPVYASLSDDLSDIYRDCKEGLLLWEGGTKAVQEDVVWQWRFSFRNHWSHHAAEALNALTWLMHHYEENDPDKAEE